MKTRALSGILGLFLLLPTSVLAQNSGTTPANQAIVVLGAVDGKTEAKRLYDEGVALFKQAAQKKAGGKSEEAKALYQQAGEKFEAAFRFDPSPILMFNNARVAEEIGDPATAIDRYRAYLSQYPSAEDAQEVRGRIYGLQKASAQPIAPLAPASQPKHAPAPASVTTTVGPSSSNEWGRREWAYVTWGGAGAAAIVSTVFGVSMMSSIDEGETRWNNPKYTRSQAQSSLDDASTYQTITFVTGGLALAAAGAGAYLFFTDDRSSTPNQTRTVTPSPTGVTIHW